MCLTVPRKVLFRESLPISFCNYKYFVLGTMDFSNPSVLVKEIKKHIKENGYDGSSTQSPSNDVDPPLPAEDFEEEEQVEVTYNNSRKKFDLDVATPKRIKKKFNISSGSLELTQDGTVYKEKNNDKFDPHLIPGKYELTITQAKISRTKSTKSKKTEITNDSTEQEDSDEDDNEEDNEDKDEINDDN